MTKRASIIQITLFCGFIAALFIANLLVPDRAFSDVENRVLAKTPAFSFSALFSGKYSSDFEAYVTDQFVLRDTWTGLKARAELFSGKKENNNVYLCEGGALIERFTEPYMERFDKNIASVRALAESTDIPVYFALIPGAAEIWKEKLPAYAPNADQGALIAYAYGHSGALNIYISAALDPHKEEYIYYKTDHHWTTLGAYYGYTELAAIAGKGTRPAPIDSFTKRAVTEEFYGTVYSSSGMHWVAPDSIEVWVESGTEAITNYPQGAAQAGVLYDDSFLAKKDKYSMFLGGNTPLMQIKTENTDAPSLLIVRDSYMDSAIPFLLAHFSEIHVVDLRYYKASLSAYIEENGIDNILVCYSLANFSEDTSLFLLER